MAHEGRDGLRVPSPELRPPSCHTRPRSDDDRQIKKLGKKADNVEREALTSRRSAPFDRPERGRVAVKVVTVTGMEMSAVEAVALA